MQGENKWHADYEIPMFGFVAENIHSCPSAYTTA